MPLERLGFLSELSASSATKMGELLCVWCRPGNPPPGGTSFLKEDFLKTESRSGDENQGCLPISQTLPALR